MAGEFVERSRHGTVFYFRRRVPRDIRARLGKRHVYVTLRTQERRTALQRARLLAVRTDQLFEEIRHMPQDKDSRYIDTFLNWHIELDPATGRPKNVHFTDIQTTEDEDRAERLASKYFSVPLAPAAKPTPTIREAIHDLLGSGEIKPRSAKGYRTVLEEFAAFFGEHVPLGEITQDRFASEYAARVRANEAWSDKTKNDRLVIAARLFNRYAGRNSAVPTITTKSLKAKRARPASQDRDAFTVDEMRALFENALQYRTEEPAKWWVTVAPAFLGCRIEEVAQAHLDGDFTRDAATGAWVLKITEDSKNPGAPAKSVKTLAGWRDVPIHPMLVRAGFIDYLSAERAVGAQTAFQSQWKPWADRKTGGLIHGQGISKWAGRELKKLRELGVVRRDAELGYFHSMRHTFITLLDKAGTREEWRAGIAGQAYGGVNSQVYSKARHDVSHTLPMIVSGLDALERVLVDLLARHGFALGPAT